MTQQFNYGAILRKLRIDAALSSEDVAGLVGVTPRTISFWESGSQPMPRERLELLLMKLERRGSYDGLVTVVAPDRITLIDVVSGRNYAGCKIWDDGTATIKSLAIDRATGRPIMHSCTFQIDGNEQVLRAADQWQRELMVSAQSNFETSIDPAALAVYEWLAKQIETAEEHNPQLRELKDRITQASHAVNAAASHVERKIRQEELDVVIRALNREIHNGA
jgi:transcriptional regulator with XRE-family HTH domain